MGTLAIIFLVLCTIFCYGEELVCTLNGKKYLNFVSDKFLSFTVDPVVLLSGINIGSSTTQLAKHLSPAYIRISGPSTEYLHYVEDESKLRLDDSALRFTSTMWKSLNDWVLDAGLTPIFAINHYDGGSETKLSTKTVFPLLEISDKLDIKCLWQIDNKVHPNDLVNYIEELKTFKYILFAFPNGNQNWKIIGPDISHWIRSGSFDDVKRTLNSFENLTEAVIWRGSDIQLVKPTTGVRLPIWLEIAKSQIPITFKSAIDWAKLIGEAASLDYELIFREPRLFEIITETPVFWLTLLHKKLMGRNVLELKPNQSTDGKLLAYCHCSKNQNDFLRRGAVTILVINDDTEERAIVLKTSTVTSRNCEVRSYILTTDFEESTSTFLNQQKLNVNMLKDKTIPKPKIRRARNQKSVVLEVPPQSIAFFVIPDARVPICISNEDDTNLIIQEISEDQDKDFEDVYHPEINSRFQEPVASLNNLYLMMEKELEDDEAFYALDKESVSRQSESWKSVLVENMEKIGPNDTLMKNSAASLNRKPIIASRIDIRKRKEDIEKRKIELIRRISDKTQILRNKLESNGTEEYENDSNTEIAKNSVDLPKRLLEGNKRAIREAKGGGRGRGRGRAGSRKSVHTTPANPKIIKTINRKPKRDINMELLEQKVKEIKEKRPKKLDTRENKRSSSKKQPEYLYTEQESPESMDLTELLDNIREKSKHKDFNRKSNAQKNPKQKITIDKTNIEDLRKKIGHLEKEKPKVEDASGNTDLDYLSDEYGNMFDELQESPDPRYFDEPKSLEDNPKFPIRPTFRVQKQHKGLQGHLPTEQDWLNREIVVDNPEDIEEAIKALEAYLNQEHQHRDAAMEDIDFSLMDYYDDVDYIDSKTPIRYKRDDNHGYTEEDIRYYKLLMSSNIRHMRENMLKQKSRALSARKEIKPVNLVQKLQTRKFSKESEASDAIPSIGNEQSFEQPLKRLSKINLDQRRPISNLRMLKNRLAQHKTVADSTSKASTVTPREKKVEEVDEETKQLIKMIKNELKDKRSRSAGTKRHKRYIDASPNKLNDGLDDTIDSISKDLNYLIPNFDDTQISIIFPSKDEISFSNSENGAEINYKHYKEHQDEDLSTCPLTTDLDLTTESISKNQTETLTSIEEDVGTLKNLTRVKSGVTKRVLKEYKLKRNITHVQKIGKKDEMHLIDNVFKSITNFVEDMHTKIKSYVIFL